MTFRHLSPVVSFNVVAMFSADEQIFFCVSGTIFGWAVVPDVCRISAKSSEEANVLVVCVRTGPSPKMVKVPAGSLSFQVISTTSIFRVMATAFVLIYM